MISLFPGDNQTAELSAEDEIVRMIIGDLLPTLRQNLATLRAMAAMWQANDLDSLIETAQNADELIAGHTPETLLIWQTVFNALSLWLETPIAEIGATPAAVLLKRYPAAG